MTEFKKVFLDTAPFVYWLDEDNQYMESMEFIMQSLNMRDAQLMTSVVTVAEYLVFPYRNNIPAKVQNFFSFLDDNDVSVYSVDMGMAEYSARVC